MTKAEKNFEVVRKYYFRKKGVVETQGYDWIGEECAGHLYPVELDRKLGFADCNGDIVVPIIYDRQMHVNNSVWMSNNTYLDVAKNGLWGLITHDGTVAVEFQWGEIRASEISEDLVPVELKGKWGFANVMTGQKQIEPVYDEVKFFKYGFAPVRIEDKWGMIDKNGTLITKVKYLLDNHFVGDFAIMYEGGYWEPGRGSRLIYDSNCKIINKKGYELVTDCSWIERTGVNTFILTSKENNKKVKSIKQFIELPNYIIVIENGEYLKGYITEEGKYSEEVVLDTELGYCPHAKYIGGGTWSAIDYTGKPINIPNDELQKVKDALLAN